MLFSKWPLCFHFASTDTVLSSRAWLILEAFDLKFATMMRETVVLVGCVIFVCIGPWRQVYERDRWNGRQLSLQALKQHVHQRCELYAKFHCDKSQWAAKCCFNGTLWRNLYDSTYIISGHITGHHRPPLLSTFISIIIYLFINLIMFLFVWRNNHTFCMLIHAKGRRAPIQWNSVPLLIVLNLNSNKAVN